MNSLDYSIMICVRPEQNGKEVQESLRPLESEIVTGDFPSRSKMWNEAILRAKKEKVIIVSYHVRPTTEHVQQLMDLLNKGYGFVSLFGSDFFGFYKEVVRRIGWFDERYKGGGQEHHDFARRIFAANIGYYEEIINVPNVSTPFLWEEQEATRMNYAKWIYTIGAQIVKKVLGELEYSYDIGPPPHPPPSLLEGWDSKTLGVNLEYFVCKFYFPPSEADLCVKSWYD